MRLNYISLSYHKKIWLSRITLTAAHHLQTVNDSLITIVYALSTITSQNYVDSVCTCTSVYMQLTRDIRLPVGQGLVHRMTTTDVPFWSDISVLLGDTILGFNCLFTTVLLPFIVY